MKGIVHVPPLPADLEELKQRITATLETVTQDMLERVWEELDYRLDVSQAVRILNICEVVHGIHMPLNISFRFGTINLMMLNIKPV